MTNENDRIYNFGNDHKIYVKNGGYLQPDRIKHYEDCFGKLNYVKYRGISVAPCK